MFYESNVKHSTQAAFGELALSLHLVAIKEHFRIWVLKRTI